MYTTLHHAILALVISIFAKAYILKRLVVQGASDSDPPDSLPEITFTSAHILNDTINNRHVIEIEICSCEQYVHVGQSVSHPNRINHKNAKN